MGSGQIALRMFGLCTGTQGLYLGMEIGLCLVKERWYLKLQQLVFESQNLNARMMLNQNFCFEIEKCLRLFDKDQVEELEMSLKWVDLD